MQVSHSVSSYREALVIRLGPSRWIVSFPPLISPHHSLLDESNTLSTSVQGIGSARRRDGGLQTVHRLLHFSQCQTELFHRAMARSMDTVPHPQSKTFLGMVNSASTHTSVV